MFCINCGTLCNDNDKFCIKCGYSVSGIANDTRAKEQEIIEQEKSRKEFEKYKIEEIKPWTKIGPWIFALIITIFVIYDYWSFKNFNWYIVVPLVVAWGILIIESEIDDGWKLRLKCKQKLYQENEAYKWHQNYNYGYIYLDSKLEFYTYKFAKLSIYLSNFLIIAILAVILFMWIGSISIAPTTIIIILLIILIINQNKTGKD